MMRYFSFDYKISDYKERMKSVEEYFLSLSDNELKELSSTYIEKLGNYILYAYDNEKGYKHIIDNEQRQSQHYEALKKSIFGIKTKLTQETDIDFEKHTSTEVGKILIEMINSYEDLVEKIDKQVKNGNRVPKDCKKTINTDIKICKDKLLEPVVTKQNQPLPRNQLTNVAIDFEKYYSDFNIIKTFLRELHTIKYTYKNKPDSDLYCICLDIEMAITECSFTELQKIALQQYIDGDSTENIHVVNLDLAIKKIIKKLSKNT